MSKLTAKQRKFCDEYIKTGNITKSAINAGYAKRSAHSIGTENLQKPAIKAYIEKQMKKLESEKIAGAKEALEYLSSVMRGEQTESVATAKGVYPDVPVSAKDRITAAKEILKRYPSDPVSKAQLRKLDADARVAEARAKSMEDNGADIEALIDKMIDNLAKEDLKDSSE